MTPPPIPLPGFVLVPAMTRAEWEALPPSVQAFIPLADALRPKLVQLPREITDEQAEAMVVYFEECARERAQQAPEWAVPAPALEHV